MAQFAIMRVKKLKSGAAVKGMAKHNFRSINTPNANSALTSQNDHRACTDVFETMDKYKSLLPKKVRKDAVHALDYLITTSPEATKSRRASNGLKLGMEKRIFCCPVSTSMKPLLTFISSLCQLGMKS